MGKKKAQTYQTTPPKSDKMIIHIDTRELILKSRNLLHVEAMKMFKSNVVESKKKKPPKYKHKLYEED